MTVITVHNSEHTYLEEVKKLTAGYENIKVFELNSPEETPSVPRNHCLDNATGKYVAFLDSDDSFNVDAFETICSYLEKNDVDIVTFRGEIEVEDKNVFNIMRTRGAYEQLKDCYVLEKGDPKRDLLFYGANLAVWSKIFKRDFLEKYHLRFDTNVTMGEDTLFSAVCFKYAKRVLVLPYVIAYKYYMNHGSLAQKTLNVCHTSESIRALTNDLIKRDSELVDANISLYFIGWGHAQLIANALVTSPNLSFQDRKYVREKMKPFIKQLPLLYDDGKINTNGRANKIMEFVKSVLLNENEENKSYFERTLLPILYANKNTDMGKAYSFEDIKTEEEYMSKVPISNYGFYKPIINVMMRLDERNIITSDEISTYSKTKDEYGNEIFIPQTKNLSSIYQSLFSDYINKIDSSTFVLFENKVHVMRSSSSKVFISDMRSTMLEIIKDDDVYNSHNKKFKSGTITSPKELVFSGENCDFTYARLLFALADRDVSQILAPFTSDILETMKCLQENWQQLVKDLFIGVVSESSGLPRELREILSAKLSGDSDRAMEIAEICRNGFEDIVKKIWPSIKRIIAAGTGRFVYKTKEMKYYTGDIPLDNGYLMSSEAIIAKSCGYDTDLYELVQNNAYMEFMDISKEENECVSMEEVEVGKKYEVVVTNFAGLYRYRTGINIMIEKKENKKIIIKE